MGIYVSKLEEPTHQAVNLPEKWKQRVRLDIRSFCACFVDATLTMYPIN